MIDELHLRDLGVIAEARLPLGPGFSAITGETGAGKTMVVTGLALLLGQRADSGVVRAGAAQASAEGVWSVPDAGPVADRVREAGGELEPAAAGTGELYLSRTVSAEGRSRATVGGRAAPAGVLAELADELVVVHGQSEQLRLRSAAAQRTALDRFGGEAVAEPLGEYIAAFRRHRELDQAVESLVRDRDARIREATELRTVLAEIEAVDPQEGEDASLAARADRLAHAEELRTAAAAAHQALSSEDDAPDVSALLGEARRALERAAGDDPALAALGEQAADLGYRAADLAGGLSAYLADLDEQGPHELAVVQERRAALAPLLRQHGSLENALATLATGSARLAELDDDGERVERLAAEREDAASALDVAADRLTAARRRAADAFGAAVTEELHALALPDATLEVAVTAGEAAEHGRDDVALVLAAHPGATPRPVARGASGGELSRVMLAIEVVLAGRDPVPTFVFDEVDAGIGGAAAIEVGRRLRRLAAAAQVIVVTHLAQVAAFATNHLSVVKQSDGSVTASSVQRLTGAAREREMARLLSGSDSQVALDHAHELLVSAEAG